jgi:hypothetical protein
MLVGRPVMPTAGPDRKIRLSRWRGRRSLARRELRMRSGGGGSALIAGASIAAVELPTALP